jgi:hypothetical protein
MNKLIKKLKEIWRWIYRAWPFWLYLFIMFLYAVFNDFLTSHITDFNMLFGVFLQILGALSVILTINQNRVNLKTDIISREVKSYIRSLPCKFMRQTHEGQAPLGSNSSMMVSGTVIKNFNTLREELDYLQRRCEVNQNSILVLRNEVESLERELENDISHEINGVNQRLIDTVFGGILFQLIGVFLIISGLIIQNINS